MEAVKSSSLSKPLPIQRTYTKQEFSEEPVPTELTLSASEVCFDNGAGPVFPEFTAPFNLPEHDPQWNYYTGSPPGAPFRPINAAYTSTCGYGGPVYNEDDVVEEQILSLLAPL